MGSEGREGLQARRPEKPFRCSGLVLIDDPLLSDHAALSLPLADARIQVPAEPSHLDLDLVMPLG